DNGCPTIRVFKQRAAYSSSVRPGLQRRQSHGGIERMEHDDNDMVDEATAVRRQLTAACAAVEHATTQGMSLAAMIFVSDDGEMLVFGVEGLDIGDVLEAAQAGSGRSPPISPCAGTDAAGRGEVTRAVAGSAAPLPSPGACSRFGVRCSDNGCRSRMRI